MNKFVLSSMGIILVLLIGTAILGIGNNRSSKWQQMPDDVRFEVKNTDNIWPNRCYVSAYEQIDANTIYFPEGYYVYEPGNKPFSSASWTFYPAEAKSYERIYSIVEISTILDK